MTTENTPRVTQADREAYNCLMQDEHYDHEPAGAWHFARHREAAEAAASAREAELVEALEFYARENSWRSCGMYMSGRPNPSSAEIDRGERARATLARHKAGQP